MKKLTLLLVSFILLGMMSIQAQQVSKVSGTVTSEADGMPIPGVSVFFKGTTVGITTDIDGKYSLKVPKGAKVIVFSFVGMKTVEVPLKKSIINVKMKSSSTSVDEVLVVAYGTAKKSAFTGSAAVVKNEQLEKRITTNVKSALVGAVPGLQLKGSTGEPGSGGGKIRIRGISSLYAGQEPLIIVDGSPYPASLSNIPQSDIESISVLKDAASAALYGARGAAGVVLITTKKGKKRDARINVNVKLGVNSRAVQEYDRITDPGEYYEAYYAQLYNRYFYGDGLSNESANEKANGKMLKDLGYNVYTISDKEQLIGLNGKLNPNAKLGRRYTYEGNEYYMIPDDWTEMAYSNALRQEYNISANARSDKSSFYVSLSYLDEDGIIEYSDYQRISARIKADYNLKKWLKVGANMGYVHSDKNSNPNMGGSWESTNLMYYTSMIAPIYPVYVRTVDKDGNPIIRTDQFGNKQYDYGVPSTNYGVGRAFMQTGNPLGSNRYNTSERTVNQLNTSLFADAQITDNLEFNARSTLIWGETQGSYYDNPFYGPKVGVNGELTKNNTTTVRTNNVQTLTYLKDFGVHNLKLMLGHEYYRVEKKYLKITAQGGFSPDIKEIDAFAKITEDGSSYTSRYNVEGFFANAEYNYDDKYFASFSFRRDASSRFFKDNRWGNFWSIGGAWLLSKENFLSDKEWIDNLKLKVSIGQQGNDNIKNYAYVDTYNLSKASDTEMSPTFGRLGNPDITWETTTNINVGTEFSFLKGRLSGNIDVYTKKTSDLLFWISIPESSGTRGYYGNVGDIRNRGVELTLNGSIIKTEDFEWNLSFNMSHNKTKILSLPESKIKETGGFIDGGMWYAEGEPLYNRMTYAYAGVNERGEALYWYDEDLTDLGKAEGTGNKTDRPGKKKSGTTTEIGHASRYAMGSSLPKIYGGFGTTVRYKNFDVAFSFDYQVGGKIMDSRYSTLMSPTVDKAEGYVFHKDWKKSWSPNNTSSNIPRWQYGDKYAAQGSDRFLTNAGYLNFQSFSVGYALPKKLIKGISEMRVYVAGENLYFWSARKGLDPRSSFSKSSTLNKYSPVRNISGGIQLTF